MNSLNLKRRLGKEISLQFTWLKKQKMEKVMQSKLFLRKLHTANKKEKNV